MQPTLTTGTARLRRASGARMGLLGAALVMWAVGAPTAALAELETWNQERATEISGQLVESMKALRRAERLQPQMTPDPSERARKNYMDTLRLLEGATKQLNRKLQQGVGREGTLQTAKKIKSLVRDAEVEGKKFLDSHQVMAAVEPVYAALDELAPYYFEDAGTSDPMVERLREDAKSRGAGKPSQP